MTTITRERERERKKNSCDYAAMKIITEENLEKSMNIKVPKNVSAPFASADDRFATTGKEKGKPMLQ